MLYLVVHLLSCPVIELSCGYCVKSVCFFFKQKTSYELRISDWSSDVCSSDLCDSCGGPPACIGESTGSSGSWRRSHSQRDLSRAAKSARIPLTSCTSSARSRISADRPMITARGSRLAIALRSPRLLLDRKSTRLNSSH